MSEERQVWVCQYRNCVANGAIEVLAAFRSQELPEAVQVLEGGCQGQCHIGANVQVMPDNVWYCQVTPEQVPTIVQEHLWGDRVVTALLNPRIHARY